MTTNEQKYFKKGNNSYPKVCRMPAWLLRFKGRWDSRKGEGVCDEFIRRLLKKEAFIETNECLDAEKILKDIREQGASVVIRLSADKAILGTNANVPLGDTPQDIRIGRENFAKRASAVSTAKAALDELTRINETIICVDTILEERIEKIRSHTEEKVHSYVSGVRSGKIPEYSGVDMAFSDKALDIYRTKHAQLDGKICDIVSNSMKEA